MSSVKIEQEKGRKAEIRLAYNEEDEVRKLFTEYTKMMYLGEPALKEYLKMQNYDDEFLHLEKKYGMPEGRLYLVKYDGKFAGCAGLRKIDDKNCELKRLYVRPEFRGHQIGKLLIEKLREDAKQIGYRYMLLDTLPFMAHAVNLYEKCGFYEIPRYNNTPIEDTIFMRMDL